MFGVILCENVLIAMVVLLYSIYSSKVMTGPKPLAEYSIYYISIQIKSVCSSLDSMVG